MGIFALEHSQTAYRADFALYGGATLALAIFLASAAPHELRFELAALALTGLACWTVIEYALHRFVLHGMAPFRAWHAEHHRRPAALICAPTVVSAGLIAVLVFAPALAVWGLWRASALTLGVLAGYLGYAITHHATHHWRFDVAWLRRRRRWHALHHAAIVPPGHYGVTSACWDHLLGSAGPVPNRDGETP